MSALVDPAEPRADVLPAWPHLLALALPLATTGWLLTAPHGGLGMLFGAFWPWLVCGIDALSPVERRQPLPMTGSPQARLAEPVELSRWAADALLYALVAVQLVNVVGFVVLAPSLSWAEIYVGLWIVGINSGWSAIVVAHELVHRKGVPRQLGRLLMASVLYEHFSTEHVRGHHKRIGTPEDPATARFGEAFSDFLLRTVPGQLRSAWGLDRRRVVEGLAFEVIALVVVAAVLGPKGVAALAGQAFWAVVLLECVNWFEHWGLVRKGKNPSTVDSWDTDAAFSLFGLVGLTRHADHHAYAARPFEKLRYVEESAKLPFGYFAMVAVSLFHNRRARSLLTKELKRKGMGPFS